MPLTICIPSFYDEKDVVVNSRINTEIEIFINKLQVIFFLI
jgi:hypothetical protein